MSYTVRGTDGIEYQLQLWDGKVYRPDVTGTYEKVQTAFEKLTGVARRLVRVDKAWPLKPRKNWHDGQARFSRTASHVASDYIEWARTHGRKRIAVYASGGPYGLDTKGLECVQVDPCEFLGPAPSAESDFPAEQLAA